MSRRIASSLYKDKDREENASGNLLAEFVDLVDLRVWRRPSASFYANADTNAGAAAGPHIRLCIQRFQQLGDHVQRKFQ